MGKSEVGGESMHRWLGALQLFIALGALAGGWGLAADRSGASVGLPLDMLKSSPFPDFLIPGIYLFTVNGLGSLVGSVFSFRRRRHAGEIAMVLGALLVAWIVIQLCMIASFSWLHPFYFVLGALEFFLGHSLRKGASRIRA